MWPTQINKQPSSESQGQSVGLVALKRRHVVPFLSTWLTARGFPIVGKIGLKRVIYNRTGSQGPGSALREKGKKIGVSEKKSARRDSLPWPLLGSLRSTIFFPCLTPFFAFFPHSRAWSQATARVQDINFKKTTRIIYSFIYSSLVWFISYNHSKYN